MGLSVGRERFVRFEGAVCRESGAAQAAEPTWRLVGRCLRRRVGEKGACQMSISAYQPARLPSPYQVN